MGTWKVMRKNSKVEPQLAINFVGGASEPLLKFCKIATSSMYKHFNCAVLPFGLYNFSCEHVG